MLSIANRNLKIFFRDRAAVLFSLLAVFIILGLYVLFLADTLVDSLPVFEGASVLINSWVLAGILAVTSVTSTMGAFGIMVEDRSRKILKDFTTSPIRRSQLTGGYILSACSVGVIMSVVTFILGELYIVMLGGELLSLLSILKVLGLIVLSVLASSSIVYFITTFLRSQNAFSAASTVIGTLIGFLTGIYVPMGSLPEAVQWVIKIFPVSHAGALIRNVMLEHPMEVSFSGAPAGAQAEFTENMGVVYHFGSYQVEPWLSIVILLVTTLLFFGLSLLNVSRKNK
ncbi:MULTISPECIES: ABC transporter permease [Paenibacillus]|jgi:multidrug/hemolysin transport system permease protein|uniref:ABC transporter permease n=1 Tax=Paenibacillus TaxID=44249 RepID=UPI00073F2701|nr:MULTISPECIES: ABC transporter permease [Paenibacillus]MDU4694996.1 ABC transporter permease [Paenibacillus sp.]